MDWRTLSLCAVLVLAGCAGVDFSGGGPAADDPTQTATESPTVTPGRAGTTGDGIVEHRTSPWGDEPIVVAVDDASDGSRDFAPLVRDALAYWENHSERYAGYPVEYDLVPDADDPDLVVSFVPRVGSCDNLSEAAGCAPYITDSRFERPVDVEVRRGLSDASTRLVVKHELGHTLGLDHSDAPQSVMAANTTLTTLPRTDAVDRDLPWDDPSLSVHVDYGNVSDEAAVREQVRHALDYYDRGADGTVPENVSFALVDSRADADVVIEFPEDIDCASGSGSCGYRAGYDPDGDGALESFNRLRITLHDVDTAAVGWHVGYWLGYGLGFDRPADWPAPFRDASASDRRSEWWEE